LTVCVFHDLEFSSKVSLLSFFEDFVVDADLAMSCNGVPMRIRCIPCGEFEVLPDQAGVGGDVGAVCCRCTRRAFQRLSEHRHRRVKAGSRCYAAQHARFSMPGREHARQRAASACPSLR